MILYVAILEQYERELTAQEWAFDILLKSCRWIAFVQGVSCCEYQDRGDAGLRNEAGRWELKHEPIRSLHEVRLDGSIVKPPKGKFVCWCQKVPN
jgi:hypothetical protein